MVFTGCPSDPQSPPCDTLGPNCGPQCPPVELTTSQLHQKITLGGPQVPQRDPPRTPKVLKKLLK